MCACNLLRTRTVINTQFKTRTQCPCTIYVDRYRLKILKKFKATPFIKLPKYSPQLFVSDSESHFVFVKHNVI